MRISALTILEHTADTQALRLRLVRYGSIRRATEASMHGDSQHLHLLLMRLDPDGNNENPASNVLLYSMQERAES
jgi:hypothetical protein